MSPTQVSGTSEPSTTTSTTRGILKDRLSRYEQFKIGRLYQANIGLIKTFGKQFKNKFPGVPACEIYSCIDLAFIKAARVWDPQKGKLSTILLHFAQGEVRHYMRTNAYWGYSATAAKRVLGMKARKLITYRNVPAFALPRILGCTKKELEEALLATLPLWSTGDLELGTAFSANDKNIESSLSDGDSSEEMADLNEIASNTLRRNDEKREELFSLDCDSDSHGN